jgi:hypothetical protein
MNVNGAANATAGLSILKKANEQPKVALEVMQKSLQGIEQAQSPQKSREVSLAEQTGKGKLINVKA